MNCRRARGLFSEYHDGVLKLHGLTSAGSAPCWRWSASPRKGVLPRTIVRGIPRRGLKADLEQEVGGHLSACPACRGELKSFETGIRILKKLKPGRPRTGGDSGTAGHKD